MESFSSNIFKRTNYAIQAFTLLTKQYYLLSPWLEQQLTWSRFINVCGVPGGNKEMDLHMEHMNCIIKCALASNKFHFLRVRKISGALASITKQFDEHTHTHSAVSGFEEISLSNLCADTGIY